MASATAAILLAGPVMTLPAAVAHEPAAASDPTTQIVIEDAVGDYRGHAKRPADITQVTYRLREVGVAPNTELIIEVVARHAPLPDDEFSPDRVLTTRFTANGDQYRLVGWRPDLRFELLVDGTWVDQTGPDWMSLRLRKRSTVVALPAATFPVGSVLTNLRTKLRMPTQTVDRAIADPVAALTTSFDG